MSRSKGGRRGILGFSVTGKGYIVVMSRSVLEIGQASKRNCSNEGSRLR